MKDLLLKFLILVGFPLACSASHELVGGGVFGNPSDATNRLTGWAVYARHVGLIWSSVAIEVVPVQNEETGEWTLSARYVGGPFVKVFGTEAFEVYANAALGAESTQFATSLTGSVGATVVTRLTGRWHVLVPVRWSNSAASRYRFSVGIGFAFK